MEYWSILRLRGILKVMVNFHSQCEVTLSNPDCMKRAIGARLIRKAVLMLRVMVLGEFLKFFRRIGRSAGVRVVISVMSVREVSNWGVSIAFTWTCTKVGGS